MRTSLSGSAATTTEIALPNGRLVRVPPGFEPATLERVLAIAAEVRGVLTLPPSVRVYVAAEFVREACPWRDVVTFCGPLRALGETR